MTFDLFGVEIRPREKSFGLWILSIEKDDSYRHLFCFFYCNKYIRLDFLFFRLMADFI